jgi:hypothetical protein
MPATASASGVLNLPAGNLVTDRQAPIAVSNVSISAGQDQRMRVCFSFTDLTTNPIKSAEFHVALLDQFGSERLAANVIRNANSQFASGRQMDPPDFTASGYTDTNDGSQSCWLVASAAEATNAIQGSNDIRVSVKVTAMQYADGTTWHPGDTFVRAFNADGSAFRFVPEAFDTTWSSEPDTAPVTILRAGLRSYALADNQPMMEQCVTFRNIGSKVATSIKIDYVFSDGNGTALPVAMDWHNTFTGTYTPPVLIEDKCWHAKLPPVATVRRMRAEVVRVLHVVYSDGSQWTRGDGWTKAYSGDGNALPSPLAMTGVVNPTTPNANPSAPSTATGLGGVIGPSGQQFGEIAWDKTMNGGFGVAVNQPTAFEAQFQAMAQCRTRAGANGGACTLMVNGQGLNSSATRCATLVSDGHVYGLGLGATPDSADLNAITSLSSRNGSIDSAKTIAKGCNVQ